MTICHEQLPPRTPININCLYICGRGTIAPETHGERRKVLHRRRRILKLWPKLLQMFTMSTHPSSSQ